MLVNSLGFVAHFGDSSSLSIASSVLLQKSHDHPSIIPSGHTPTMDCVLMGVLVQEAAFNFILQIGYIETSRISDQTRLQQCSSFCKGRSGAPRINHELCRFSRHTSYS